MTYKILLISLFTVFIFSSCNSDKKEAQSNVTGTKEEEVVFAQSLFGDEASLMVKQDFTAQGKERITGGSTQQKK